MLNISSLKFVSSNNPHNFVRAAKIPVRGRCLIEQEKDNTWFDKYGIEYTYNKERPYAIEILINNECPLTITNYINSLPEEITVVIIRPHSYEKNTNCFNSIIKALSSKTNRNILIDTTNSNFSITNNIYFSSLPNNVKVGNLARDYSQDFYGENSLDWWSLHANKKNYYDMLIKLIPKTRRRIEILNKIARDFYLDLKDIFPNLDNMNNLEKANLVFKYCSKTIQYDSNSTIRSATGILKPRNDCDFSSDPIETYLRKKGVCTGRSRLMKLLLNNKYMKVPCFLTSGYIPSGEGHEWVEVYQDNERYYYDLSFGIKGNKNSSNNKINHEDYEKNGTQAIRAIERKEHYSGNQYKKNK